MKQKVSKIRKDVVQPTIFTIFGITGDLAKKYLLVSLYNLCAAGELPAQFYLVGYGRRKWSDAEMKAFVVKSLKGALPKFNSKIAGRLLRNAYYVVGDFATPGDYINLKKFLAKLERDAGMHLNKIFYVATAPLYYPEIFKQLGSHGLAHSTKLEQTRILIEKPFGTDAKSAASLNKILHAHFTEEQIFRVDHYLGKLPIQNILSFRFGNGIFEKIWNSQHIDNIQISAVMEDVGIEGRGAFYDETGALLDVVQNHIMQVVALVCMDAPFNMDAECVSERKAQLLKKVRISQDGRDVVRGQYSGYTREQDVRMNSNTETFVALKLFVDTPAFRGVPIYIRTGKALDRRFTDVVVQFKQDSVHFLGNKKHGIDPNLLSIRVQPEESISLRIMVREPGFETQLKPAQMDFCYPPNGEGAYSPSAYEKVIYDALHGDQVSLVRSDVLMQQWRIVDALQKKWRSYPLEIYKQGSEGACEPAQSFRARRHAVVERGNAVLPCATAETSEEKVGLLLNHVVQRPL